MKPSSDASSSGISSCITAPAAPVQITPTGTPVPAASLRAKKNASALVPMQFASSGSFQPQLSDNRSDCGVFCFSRSASAATPDCITKRIGSFSSNSVLFIAPYICDSVTSAFD